jgi:hypothetical protein
MMRRIPFGGNMILRWSLRLSFFKAARVWGRLDGVLGAGLREEQLRSFLHDVSKKVP